MATSANQKDVSLNINVGVNGDENVKALADDFRAVGAAGEAGEAQLAGLTAELEAAKTKVRELRAAESAAAAQATATRNSIAAQREALTRQRLTTDETTRATDDYKASVKAARIAILDSRAALREQSAAQDKAATSARVAAAAEAKLAVAHKAAQVAAAQAAEQASVLSVTSEKLGGMLQHLGGIMTAAFSAEKIAETTAEMTRMHRAFDAIFGANSASELKFVREQADKVGVSFFELGDAYKRLAASTRGTTLEGAQTREVFVAVTQAARTLGLTSDQTARALAAVAQMASTGKVNMTELRRELGVDMPGAMQALADGAGITTAQINEMSKSGDLMAKDVLPALARGLDKMYGHAAPPPSVAADWERFQNAVRVTASELGDLAANGYFKVVDVIKEASPALVNAELALGGTLDEVNEKTKALSAATQAQVRAVDNLVDATANQRESMLSIDARYSKMLTDGAKLVEQRDAQVKAAQAEGQALTQLVNVYGNESERRQAAAHSAEMQSAALRNLAHARNEEAIVARSYAIKLAEEAKARNDETQATKDQIKEAEQAATVKRAEADAAIASATAKNIEAQAAKANAEASKDLSTRVYELRGAAQSAAAEVERLVDAQKRGKATAEQVADAEAKAAAATLLYRDALHDAAAAAERKVQAEQRAASLAQGAIDVERERAMAIRDVAHASGDEATAARANEQAQQLQVQAARAAADAASHEAAAMRDSADAKETEARATGTLTPVKQDEIAATRDAAAAKDLEAQKAEILASKLDGLTAAEQRRTSTARDAAKGDGRATSLVPLDKAAAVMQNHGDGMSVDDLKAAAKQANDGKAWLDNMVKAGGGADIDPSAYASIMGMQAATRTALENAQRKEARDTRQKAAAAAPAPAAVVPHQVIRHEIPTLGRTHVVDTIGQQSADAMGDLIKTLTAGKATA
jgi:tape measure domain-containing protein